METLRRIAVYAVPMVWRTGLSFAVLPLTTYRLDPADFGIFAFIISFSSFAVGASAMGSMYAFSSHFSKLDIDGQRELVSTLLWLGIAVGVALAAAVIVAWPLIARLVPEIGVVSGAVVWIVGLLIVLGVPWNHASAIILVTGRAGDFAYINVVESIGTTAGTLIALYGFNLGVESLFIGALVGALTNATASLASIRQYVRIRFSWRWMAECLHVSSLAVLSSLVERGKATVEAYALARYVGVSALGIFRHSQQYMNLAKSGVNAVSFATWPAALEEARAPEKGFPHLGRVWPATQLGLGLTGLLMATLGSDAIDLLTHGKFGAAYVFATLWIVFVMFENAAKPAVAVVYAHNQGVANQRLALLGSVSSVALMIPLVAWLGAYGAVLGNFVSVLIYRSLVVVIARRFAPLPFQDGTMFIGMAIVLAALGATMTMGDSLLKRGAILIVACVVLLAACQNAWRPIAGTVFKTLRTAET